MKLPIYELKISEEMNEESEVQAIAIVDFPAIKKDFLVFNEQFVQPSQNESESDFMSRCISYNVGEGKDQDQAVAICSSKWQNKFNAELSIYEYTPKHFDMCPGAIATFTHLVSMNVGIEEQGMVRSAAQIADNIFGIEKEVIAKNFATTQQVIEVEILTDDFVDLMREIDKLVGMVHNVDYMYNHLAKVKSYQTQTQNFQSYTDYPKQAQENAKIALRWAEENGWGECGTPVGKARANQLANGEPISRDTIARMSGFERHRQNSQKELGDGCGRLMWLAWGGDAGVEWATRKLEQIDKMRKQERFSIVNEDKRIISGALMIAEELIYRNNELGEHYVKFSADTIKAIAIKFAKKQYNQNVNLMHDPKQKVEGVTMFESWLTDSERGILPMKGFENVPDGSWFGSFYVENEEVWKSVKSGDYKGFSVEGMFEYDKPMSMEENTLKKIEKLLNEIITD
jgi:hypothetical protein